MARWIEIYAKFVLVIKFVIVWRRMTQMRVMDRQLRQDPLEAGV